MISRTTQFRIYLIDDDYNIITIIVIATVYYWEHAAAYTGFSEGFARAPSPRARRIEGYWVSVVRAETTMWARATHHGKTVAGRHTAAVSARARAMRVKSADGDARNRLNPPAAAAVAA